jgi:transketolase N-terminal domain/subunit
MSTSLGLCLGDRIQDGTLHVSDHRDGELNEGQIWEGAAVWRPPELDH